MSPDPAVVSITTPSDTEIRITREVAAPRPLVYAVHTQPEHVPHWLTGPPGWTMTVCEIDLRPGGAWRWVWEHPVDGRLELSGEYLEIVAPERVVNTESWGPSWPSTTNTLALSETGPGTLVTTTIVYGSQQARDQALASGMSDGMTATYARLDGYLVSLG